MEKNNLQVKRSETVGRYVMFLLSFVGVFLLCTLFPYTGDDWAWGTSIGLERLLDGFDEYNGRYLGNFLVIVLTRSKFLRNFTIAGTIFLISFISYKYVNRDKFTVFLIGMAMFFSMPRFLFRQSIVWCSGFTNYVPPILMTLIYLNAIKNIFGEKIPTYRRGVGIGVLFAGIAGGLFIEHVTIYNVALAVFIIVYSLIKFRKAFLPQIMYFIGTVAGALIMFSNGAYTKIFSGNDEYRNVSNESADIWQRIEENCNDLYSELMANNIILNIFICVMMIFLCCKFLKRTKEFNKKSGFAMAFLVIDIAYVVYTILLAVFPEWTPVTTDLEFMPAFNLYFMLIYSVSLVGTVVLCTEKKRLCKIILPLLSAYAMCVPLMVVYPIGSRCFFPMYVMITLFAAEVFNYVTEDFDISAVKVSSVVFAAVMLISGIYYGCIYSVIHSYDVRRVESVREQISEGKKEVELCYLPFGDFTWNANPESNDSVWAERMKLFYGFDNDITFSFVNYKEFDGIKEANEYDY